MDLFIRVLINLFDPLKFMFILNSIKIIKLWCICAVWKLAFNSLLIYLRTITYFFNINFDMGDSSAL